jgi:hypothetical protein
MKKFRFLLVSMLFTTSSFAQVGTRPCESAHYSTEYKPAIVRSISDLPNHIQDSITKHLLNKLGTDFYDLLTFESCLVIDYKALVGKDPKVLHYRWRVPKYDMGFYITQKHAGIDYCCSRMTLDSTGAVIGQIDFPDHQVNLQSSTFVDLAQIKKTAKKLRFDPDRYAIDFTDDHVVLEFARAKRYRYIEFLEISAHTGQKIRQYRVTGIIDWGRRPKKNDYQRLRKAI